MKRDVDLIHQILSLLEAHDPAAEEHLERRKIAIPGHDDKVVEQHVMLLIEAGYLVDRTAERRETGSFIGLHGTWLTWDGYDLLARMNGETKDLEKLLTSTA